MTAGQSKQTLSAVLVQVQLRHKVKALCGFKLATLHFWHINNHCLITHDLGLTPTHKHTHLQDNALPQRPHRTTENGVYRIKAKLNHFSCHLWFLFHTIIIPAVRIRPDILYTSQQIYQLQFNLHFNALYIHLLQNIVYGSLGTHYRQL